MANPTLKYQCPACSGPVHFDANKQMIVCDHCSAEFTKEDFTTLANERAENASSPTDPISIDWKTEGVLKEHEVLEEQTGFTCSSCGAEIVADATLAATECMYCGNPIVLSNNVSGMVKPDYILPFKIDKVKAEKMLLQFYTKKILLPSAFRDQNRIKKIAGMYVPFWLFSGKGEGWIDYHGQVINKSRSGDYEVTTTRHYNISRAGSVKFTNIPVDASKKMEDNYMDGLEPYDYNEMAEFDPSYMAGYFADKFDVSVDECATRAQTRTITSTKAAMKATVSGYSSVLERASRLQLKAEKVQYAMLPVWMLNTKYKGKMHHFAINGQTGRVSGDLPVDKKKRWLLQSALTIGLYVLLAILSYWLFS